MLVKVDNPELPEELAAVTTSVWLVPDMMMLGVMRQSFLDPPYLWAHVIKAGVRNVRRAPAFVDELQHRIRAPIVYAEADASLPRNQALLTYLGFKEVREDHGRKLYLRSVQ